MKEVWVLKLVQQAKRTRRMEEITKRREVERMEEVGLGRDFIKELCTDQQRLEIKHKLDSRQGEGEKRQGTSSLVGRGKTSWAVCILFFFFFHVGYLSVLYSLLSFLAVWGLGARIK